MNDGREPPGVQTGPRVARWGRRVLALGSTLVVLGVAVGGCGGSANAGQSGHSTVASGSRSSSSRAANVTNKTEPNSTKSKRSREGRHKRDTGRGAAGHHTGARTTRPAHSHRHKNYAGDSGVIP